MLEKRKKLKKEGRHDVRIPEDDPEKYTRTKYVMVMKLFADMERKRQQLDIRDQEERKRKREHEIEEEETKKGKLLHEISSPQISLKYIKKSTY